MSKDLHPSILEFFRARMDGHTNVTSLEDVSTDEYFIFRIVRSAQRDTVIVWLSDAYHFTDMDFFNRPLGLGHGDFILVAKPEAGLLVDTALIDEARVGVGKIGKFMGALRSRNMWQYLTPEEKDGGRR